MKKSLIRLQEVGRVDFWVVKVKPGASFGISSRPWLEPCSSDLLKIEGRFKQWSTPFHSVNLLIHMPLVHAGCVYTNCVLDKA